MQATILINCPINRYKAGEKGTVLPNDSDKYQYKVELTPLANTATTGFLAGVKEIKRIYYFHADEVSISKE